MISDLSSDQSSCCAGGDCCQPAGGDDGGRSRLWKTLVFAAVLLLAGAVTAYSVFWRDPEMANSSCCGTPSADCATPCGTAAAIAGLDDKLEDTAFALVVFLPGGCLFPEQAGREIHTVITELAAEGTQVRMLYFTPADSAFARAVDRYKITNCPTVLVHTTHGQTVLAGERITSDTILQIYRRGQTADPGSATSTVEQSG